MPMPKKGDLDCCVAALEDEKENDEKQAGLLEADEEEDHPSPDTPSFLGHLWDHFEVMRSWHSEHILSFLDNIFMRSLHSEYILMFLDVIFMRSLHSERILTFWMSFS